MGGLVAANHFLIACFGLKGAKIGCGERAKTGLAVVM